MKRLLCVFLVLFLLFIAVGCGYSESDIERTRDEAYREGYDEGYEKGREEGIEIAWEEARTVLSDINDTMEKGAEEFNKYGYMTDKAAEYYDKVFSIIGEYY